MNTKQKRDNIAIGIKIYTNAAVCFSANIRPSTSNKCHHVQPTWHADNKVIAFVFSRELVIYLSAPNVMRNGTVMQFKLRQRVWCLQFQTKMNQLYILCTLTAGSCKLVQDGMTLV